MAETESCLDGPAENAKNGSKFAVRSNVMRHVGASRFKAYKYAIVFGWHTVWKAQNER